MTTINTSQYSYIILDTLPPIDRNAVPLTGADPSTFFASLTSVLAQGGWPVPKAMADAAKSAPAAVAAQSAKAVKSATLASTALVARQQAAPTSTVALQSKVKAAAVSLPMNIAPHPHTTSRAYLALNKLGLGQNA